MRNCHFSIHIWDRIFSSPNISEKVLYWKMQKGDKIHLSFTFMHEFEWKMVLVYIVNVGKSSKGTALDHRTLWVRFSSFKYCQTKVGYAKQQKIWHVNRNKRRNFLLMLFEFILCYISVKYLFIIRTSKK